MRNFYKFTFFILYSICVKAQVVTPTIVVPSNTVCAGSNLALSAAPLNSATLSINSYSWSVSPTASVTLLSDKISQSFSVNVANSGRYVVTLKWEIVPTGTNAPVTTFSASKTIIVEKYAKASFNATMSNEGFPSQLILTNYSSNFIKNYWVFDHDFNSKDSTTNTAKSYNAGGSYNVMLVAIGNNNCNDTSRYDFRISDSSSVVLPTIFTPNNDDVNDTYKPLTRGIYKLNAKIYDRYGVIICSWDRINGFWDGHTTSGLECAAGEYFVIVEATGFDGQLFKLKKAFTLIR